MEDLEVWTIESACLKPTIRLSYFDDIFVIWRHGNNEIQLLFLDVLVNNSSRQGHLQQGNRFLNTKSYHDSAQLETVIRTLVTWSQKLPDTHSQKQAMDIFRSSQLQNRYSDNNIKQTQTHWTQNKWTRRWEAYDKIQKVPKKYRRITVFTKRST